MSLPNAVFVDTSIFAGQQYNFDSTAFASFISAAKIHSLKLLLPDPTAREIRRQIKERSDEALNALAAARRRAPFLSKWKHFSQQASPPVEWEVRRIAERELQAFLKQFNVVTLDYADVDVRTVMNWYDSVEAPFGPRKRKEFPDAFAVASLAAYASKSGDCIAVVSADDDFGRACERFPALLYFPSLSSLTEVLLLADTAFAGLGDVIRKGAGAIEESILEAASGLVFFHQDDCFDAERSHIDSAVVTDIRIVGIGSGECTVMFDADLECLIVLAWDGHRKDGRDSEACYDGILHRISGNAKVKVTPDGQAVSGVSSVELDSNEMEVTTVPSWYNAYYE